jgi:CheY-like chemotaxis protein
LKERRRECWHIEVESEEGSGTLFRITLPVCAQQMSSPSWTIRPDPSRERLGRVLVIDDDQIVLRAVNRLLKGHAVVCTTSAREPLSLLCEQGERFDVILSDLMMPDMTGMDFFEALLRASPDLAHRVVFMTGGALTMRVADFLSTVPNLHLEKPFDFENLRAAVQEAMTARSAH